MFNEIISFYNKTKGEGKSPSKLFKKFDTTGKYLQEMKKKYGDYNINILLYSTYNNLNTVPYAACGKIKKFSGLTVRDMCNSYRVNCEESCPECHYHLKEVMNENRRKSVHGKYGVESVSQIKEVRNKAINTMQEKYGVENISKLESVKKRKKEKFEDKSTEEIENIYLKIKNTTIDRYGVSNAAKSEVIKNKVKETFIRNYGSENVFNSTEFKNRNRIITAKRRHDKIMDYIDSEYSLTFLPFEYSEEHCFHCLKCNSDFSCNIQNYSTIRCHKCYPVNVSNEEREFFSTISDMLDCEIIYNNRYSFLDNKEIDFYIPELNIGIEYNGSYWHNSTNKDEHYHQNKCKAALDNGINLIQIYDTDVIYNKEKVVNRLKHLFKINNKKVYARKCEIKTVSTKDCNDFMNDYHFQGECVSKIRLGLYYQDELVSMCTFGKSRFDKKYDYELLRFCSKYNVVGAFSKLLKYFEKTHNPKSLITYADFDWSNGNLYSTNSFEFLKLTNPGYFYVDKKKIKISRYECQKHKLLKKYDWTTNDMTESEICNMLGYNKIYNSGNMVFVKFY